MSDRVKMNMEFIFRCSAKFLYKYISNPSGLAEWFADDVKVNGNKYTFVWGDSEVEAELLDKKLNKHVRFEWVDNPGELTELLLKEDQMTGDLALMVSEYCDEGEEEDTESLWESSIGSLRNIIGA